MARGACMDRAGRVDSSARRDTVCEQQLWMYDEDEEESDICELIGCAVLTHLDGGRVQVLTVLDMAQALHVGPTVTVLAAHLPALTMHMLTTEARGVAILGEANVVLRELRKREIMYTVVHVCEYVADGMR